MQLLFCYFQGLCLCFQQSFLHIQKVLRAHREAAQAQLQILHRVGRVAHRKAADGHRHIANLCGIQHHSDKLFHGLAGRAVVVLGAGKLPVCRVGILGQVVGADHKKIDPVLYKFLSGQAGSGYAEHHAELCILLEGHAPLPQTLAAVLVDLTAQEECQTAVSVNHQRAYGSDVLSRISASNGGKKWEMQRCIRQDLQKLIRELLQKEKITEQQIQRIVIAGNTTMCHLLRGFSCETLGVAPFLPVDLSWMEGSAADFLGMKELDTKVVILPGISAFVGADIMAGIAKMNMHRSEGYHLLLDIGTNGEMVLGNCRHMYVTSTSAGPAFEGGNISCGMAGIPGVISHVFMEETGKAGFQMIGETDGENKKQQVIGICGTGMIDLVYELREHQMIDEHGTYSDLYFDTGYELAEKIKFTQNDIRELQMAKAAIRAGVDILVKKAGITFDEVDDCYLAGGFGTKIDIKKAAGIGLIPKELEMKTIPAGNTVLAGTKEVLLGRISKEELEKIQTMAEVINLAEENDFEELYLSYMDF